MINKYVLIYLTLSISVAQVIPPNDPIYRYLNQKFRQEHNLRLLIKAYPFTNDDLTGIRYTAIPKSKNFRFAPSLKVSENIPDLRMGIWINTWKEKFSILAEPVVVNKNYGQTILGEKYHRGGISGRFENALLRYKADRININFGRSPVWWGQSWHSSIIMSGHYPPYDHLSTKINFDSFYFELLAGQLHSVKVDSIGRFKRFISGKRITYLSNNEKLIINAGDLVVYSGLNRSVEFQYLNPVAPFFFADLESEIERYKELDNDNVMIFFDGRYAFNKPLSIYFEFLIDDFQMTISNRDTIPDALALKLGVDGALKFNNRSITYEFEYTKISGNTYITRGWFTNWEDRNIPIGYKYGPDSESLYFFADYWISRNFLFFGTITYLEKGSLTFDSQYDENRKLESPSNPVKYYTYCAPAIVWHHKYGKIETGWEGDINNNGRNSFYFKLQLILDFGFND